MIIATATYVTHEKCNDPVWYLRELEIFHMFFY
jgi:hypothetical protein